MSSGAPSTEQASPLAQLFVVQCRSLGLDPPPELRLIGLGPDPHPLPTTPADAGVAEGTDPYLLGERHEQLLTSDERRGRGAWYTPRKLAGELVARTVTEPGVVADPAMGGGVFLLAAAEHLHGYGLRPSEIVGSLLWGADVDPLAVAVAEASLWLWSARLGDPAVAGDRLAVGDALVGIAVPAAAAVVGNPPFLGQLRRRTTVDDDRRAALKARFDGCVAAYTDMAWLFLLAATEAVEPGGRVTLIQPQSLLAARDAAVVRARIDQLAAIEACWVDDGTTFAASVEVCAPTLVRRHRVAALPSRAPRRVGTDTAETSENDWVRPLLDHLGVPRVVLESPTGRLADRAEVVAGFRDEYYGLVGAIGEGGSGPGLVTSGAIDPLRRRHGTVTFARKQWADPRIDVDATDGRARRWVEAQLRPGLLVASQTKVIEALVDEAGDLVVGVPGVAVLPHDPGDLWLLAAVLHAPCVSAWMMARTAGTGMSAPVCRPTAALVGEIPLPGDRQRWADAARLARRLRDGHDCWADFAATVDAAYGVDDTELRRWWLGRLPPRPASVR